MIRRSSAFLLIIFFILGPNVLAQDEDLRSTIDYKITKMQKELNLTDSQADAIRPIIKDYLVKRKAVLDEIAGQGIVDHVEVKSTLKELQKKEYQQLGKILSEDQLKKWINKETLMATLNPDSEESSMDSDSGTALTPSGADFKF